MDIVERLLEVPTMGHDAGCVAEAAEEIKRLRAALKELEGANGALCTARTNEQYLRMLDLGQQDALLRLDEARQAARELLKVHNARQPVCNLSRPWEEPVPNA